MDMGNVCNSNSTLTESEAEAMKSTSVSKMISKEPNKTPETNGHQKEQ